MGVDLGNDRVTRTVPSEFAAKGTLMQTVPSQDFAIFKNFKPQTACIMMQ